MSAIDLSYFCFTFCEYFASVFAKHTTKYETLTIHFSYFIQILCFVNTTKKPIKSFDISQACHNPWCEIMRNEKRKKNDMKCEKSETKYNPMHFSFFTFCEHFMLFRNKCITRLMSMAIPKQIEYIDVTGRSLWAKGMRFLKKIVARHCTSDMRKNNRMRRHMIFHNYCRGITTSLYHVG